MTKKRLILAALTLLILAFGVGCSQEDVLTEPPALTVQADGTSVTALRGTSSWQHTEDGRNQGTNSDSVHPLDAKDDMPALDLPAKDKPKTVTLDCDVAPDKVTATSWGTDQWGQTDAAGSAVKVEKNDRDEWILTLADKDAIYSVNAEWTSHEDYEGTATYSFYTKTQTAEKTEQAKK